MICWPIPAMLACLSVGNTNCSIRFPPTFLPALLTWLIEVGEIGAIVGLAV